jgi:hypothetical protein
VWVLRNFLPWKLEVSSISTLCIPHPALVAQRQGWVTLQEKRSLRYLPGHVLKELRCLLASMVGSALWLWIRLPWRHPKLYEDHHGTAGPTHSDSIAFQRWNQKLELEARMNQATHSYNFTPEVITVFPPQFLLGKLLNWGIPFRGFWELIRLPFCPVGWDLTEGWLPPQGLTMSGWNCWVSWSTSLWSPVGARPLRGLELQGEGGPGIRLGDALPCSFLSSFLLWCSPAASRWLKGPEWLESCCGLQKCCRKIVWWEIKWHSEKQDDLDFIWHWQSQMSSHSKFWASNSKIIGFLHGRAGNWVIVNVLVANRWTHTGG